MKKTTSSEVIQVLLILLAIIALLTKWGTITQPTQWEHAGYDYGTVLNAFSSQSHYSSRRYYQAVIKLDEPERNIVISVPAGSYLRTGDRVTLSTKRDKKNHNRRKYKYGSKGVFPHW